jgi:predicted permease
MISVFLSLAGIALIGSLLQHLFPGWNVEEFRKSINRLVLYVLLPALVFNVIYSADLRGVLLEVPLIAGTGILVCLLFSWLLFKWIPVEDSVKGPLILASAFGNVTYLGLPVLQGLFPQPEIGIAKVAILCEITAAPLNLIVGSLLAISYSGKKGIGIGQSLRQVIQLPPLWAMFAALLLRQLPVPVPHFVIHGTQVLGAGVAGLMILSLGMALQFQRISNLWPILTVSGIKLLLSPLIIFGIGGLITLNQNYFEALTIEAAMPSQLLTLVIADRFKLDTKPLAQAILITTVLAFFTIPFVRSMLF